MVSKDRSFRTGDTITDKIARADYIDIEAFKPESTGETATPELQKQSR